MGVGCTLINSYGDVQPLKVVEAGTNDGTVEASGDAGTDSGSAVDASDGNDGAPPPLRGAIVIGGVAVSDAGETFVLTALDPYTGSELPHARETMTVSAVQYDGERDLWYIFESGGQGIFPLATDAFYVHTRRLNQVTGDWTELGKAAIPPGLSFGLYGTLVNSIGYVAYGEADAGALDGGSPASYSVIVLNSTDPANVSVDSVYPLWSSPPSALVPTRTPSDTYGGSLSLATSVKQGSATVTQLTRLGVELGASGPRAPMVGTAGVGSIVGYAPISDTAGNMSILVVSRGFGTSPATASIYSPASDDQLSSMGVFPFGDGNVKAPAFSDCDQLAFVVGTNSDLNVYAVNISGAASVMSIDPDAGPPVLPYTSAPTGHSGQGVYYEPFTKTVLTPFSQSSNFVLTAFTLGGTPTSPTLVERQSPRWVPPADIRPNFVGTAIPYPPNCALFPDE
jgi:hypothetical protein